MPHSRCNCRCVMCDIWKANHEKRELPIEVIERHVVAFKKFGVREIVLSGGEPLMHSNFWRFASVLKDAQIRLTLLSTGLLLAKNAKDITFYLHGVIVSLDGSKDVHDNIRQIPNCFEKLAEGVAALKAINPKFPVTGRCVIQRKNFRDIPNIVASAKAIGLDQISFLPADISSSAFNRSDPWSEQKKSEVALTPDEVDVLESILDDLTKSCTEDFNTHFIAESQEKLKRIAEYFRAVNGNGNYPKVNCNAPWVSAVIESNGDVHPCFFHKPYGNLYSQTFEDIVNSDEAVHFRRNLNIDKDPVCQKCVCTLRLGVTEML